MSEWKQGDIKDFLNLTDNEVASIEWHISALKRFKKRLDKFKKENHEMIEKWRSTGLLNGCPASFEACVAWFLEDQVFPDDSYYSCSLDD